MKRFIISLISTFTLLLAFSCARMEELANMKVYADDDPVTCDFTLEVENPLVETKATYMPSTLNKITNVNVWIYRDGTLLSDYSFYKSDYASDPHLPMMFPSASASYNVYLFANVGQKTAPANEANIGTVSFSVNDYSSFINNGFPMANSVLNYTPSGGQSISIKRLVGVYYISLAQSSDKITWEVTGGRVCNVPKVVRPFGTLEGFEGYASKIENASEKLSSGDLLSSGDISSLNGGGSVTLYYLENCQGQLLPGNTDYRLKKLDAPEFSGIKDFCTYLQLDCSAVTPTATYSNIHYNFYLGEDATTDFSVRRSTQHAFSLQLSSDIISTEEEWFIEPDDPIKTGILCFADTRYTSSTCPSGYQSNTNEDEYRRPYRKVSKIYAMKGLKSLYYIYRSDPQIRYTITTNETSRANPRISLKAQEVDDHFVALLIGSNVDFSTATTYETVNGRRAYYENAYPYTRNPYESETSNTKIYITSYDGLLKDSLLVQCLDRKPSLRFTYTNNGWSSDVISGAFQYKVSNPLGLRIYTYFHASYVSTVTYYPNGTYSSSSTSTRRVTGERSWRYSAAKYGTVSIQNFSIHYTASGSSTYTSYTGGSGSGKLSDLFTCGWDLYGKNYTTGLAVGSNWYNKHAEPKSLAMQVQFQYDLPCPQRMFPDIGLGWSERLPLNVQNICPDLSLGVGKTDGSASCVNFGEDIGVAITSGVKSGGTSTTTYNMMEVNRDNYPTGISNMKDFTMSLYNSMVDDDTEAWGPNKAYAYQTSSSTSPSLLTGTAFTELRMTTRTDYAPSGHYAWDEWMLDLGFTNDGSSNYSGNIAVNLFGSTVVD